MLYFNVRVFSTRLNQIVKVKRRRRLKRRVSLTLPAAQSFQMLLTFAITRTDNDPHDENSVTEDKSLEIDVQTSAWPVVVSLARQEWEQQKTKQQQINSALDSLMSLVGLEEAKSQFMTIKYLVDTARRQDVNLAQEGFCAVFVGSRGSGKSTVAELYAQFLSVLGVVPNLRFEQMTGARLADGGVTECKEIIKRLESTVNGDNNTGSSCKMTRGVIFIDGAHELVLYGTNRVFNYLGI